MTLLSFEYKPFASVVFFLLFLFFCYLFLYRFKKKSLAQFFQGSIQAGLVYTHSTFSFFLRVFLLLLTFFLGALALFKPYILSNEPIIQRSLSKRALFLIDTSDSMLVDDERGGRTRLSLAKEIAREFVLADTGALFTLYAFNKDAHLVHPETIDRVFFLFNVESLFENPFGQYGTNVFSATHQVLKGLLEDERRQTVILMTDGENTVEGLDGGSVRSLLREMPNVNLLIVALGKEEGGFVPHHENPRVVSRRDLATLQELEPYAKIFTTDQKTPLQIASAIHELFQEDIEGRLEKKGERLYERIYMHAPFLFFALFCFLLFLINPFKVQAKKILLFLFIPFIAFATPQDLIEQRNLSQAKEQLMKLYELEADPYQAQEHAYNLGLIFLLEGDNKQAIAFFEQIHFEKQEHPLLLYYVSYNLALSYLGIAREAVDGAIQKKALHLAKRHLEGAKKARCLLYSLFELPCTKGQDIESLEEAIFLFEPFDQKNQEEKTLLPSEALLNEVFFSLLETLTERESGWRQGVDQALFSLNEVLKLLRQEMFDRFNEGDCAEMPWRVIFSHVNRASLLLNSSFFDRLYPQAYMRKAILELFFAERAYLLPQSDRCDDPTGLLNEEESLLFEMETMDQRERKQSDRKNIERRPW